MVDPILTPAASVAGFTFACIGLYALLRTAVETVYKDVQAFKSWERDIESDFLALKKLEGDMQEWRDKWMVWIPESLNSLYEHFWGVDNCAEIQRRLAIMHKDMGEARKKLKSWIEREESGGQQSKQLNGLTLEGSSQTVGSDAGIDLREGRSKSGRKWFSNTRSKFSGASTAIQYAYGKKTYLKDLLDKLGKSRDAINTVAERAWRARRASPPDNNIVHDIGISHLLIPLALKLYTEVDGISQSLQNGQYNVELELAMGLDRALAIRGLGQRNDSRIARSAAIAKYATLTAFKLSVLAQKKPVNTTSLVRVKLESFTDANEGADFNADSAFSKIIKRTTEEVYYSLNPTTQVRLSAPELHNPNEGHRLSLRELLCQDHPPSYAKVGFSRYMMPYLLGQVSKYRIAFELSQTCFLLMHSMPLRRLCSCNLQCGKVKTSTGCTYESAITISDFAHKSLRWTNNLNMPHPQWCQNELVGNPGNQLTTPMRRLGILLLEITFGTTVYSLAHSQDGAVTEVILVHGGSNPFRMAQNRLNISDLKNKLQDLSAEEKAIQAYPRSLNYAEAIINCLITVFSPDVARESPFYVSSTGKPEKEDLQRVLRVFYWNVLVKLKDYYHQVEQEYSKKEDMFNSLPA